ncbi:MAG: transporter substrate-binding domain-containing protein [Chthoniobacter sp.]
MQIENTPFAGLIPALKTSRIDLVISSMTATPERAQSIDFSDPYLKTGLCLLVGAKTDIQSIADADRAGAR